MGYTQTGAEAVSANGITPEVIQAIIRAEQEAQEPKKAAAPEQIRLKPLEQIEELEAEWLIPGRIPKNQITILAGDGGSGKTALWCNIAAAISAGRVSILEESTPGEDFADTREPQKVVYFSSEDSSTYVLKRRLREAGAAMENIYTLDITDSSFGKLKFDSPELEEILKRVRPALCIFDPLQAFIPNKVNMGYRNEMRNQLAPLISYGERYGVTFLIIMHANKQKGVWGRKRLADSADIWDIARSVLMVGDAGNGGKRYLSQEKCNYGPTGDTILFQIGNGGRVILGGKTDKKDMDFVAAALCESPAPARRAAKDAIREVLEQSGEMPLGDLKGFVMLHGFGRRSFDAARKEMFADNQLFTRKLSRGRGRGVLWLVRLPGQAADYDPGDV